MFHKSSQQFLSLFTKSKVNLTSTVSNSTPFCQGRGAPQLTQSQNIISINPYVKITRFFN